MMKIDENYWKLMKINENWWKLIKINGRSKDIGKPLIYVVTNEFLIAFGIGSVSELPKLKEVNEIINQNPASWF